jgi:hypothetical protein
MKRLVLILTLLALVTGAVAWRVTSAPSPAYACEGDCP